MKKLLLRLADTPTPQIPQRWLRYLDRYFLRSGRHRDRPGAISGYALRAKMKTWLDPWWEVYHHDGIQAAIALNC